MTDLNDDVLEEEEEESQFSITRSLRKSTSISLDEPVSLTARSAEHAS
jgi:hypothetical protein